MTDAVEALDVLQQVREYHTPDDDTPYYKHHDGPPPALAMIDELRRSFGHDRDTVDVSDRVAVLTDPDTPTEERQRRAVLARLESLAEASTDLARPRPTTTTTAAGDTASPFGQSPDDAADRITAAVEALRDALGADGDSPHETAAPAVEGGE